MLNTSYISPMFRKVTLFVAVDLQSLFIKKNILLATQIFFHGRVSNLVFRGQTSH